MNHETKNSLQRRSLVGALLLGPLSFSGQVLADGHGAAAAADPEARREAVRNRIREMGESVGSADGSSRSVLADKARAGLNEIDDEMARLEDWSRDRWSSMSEAAREAYRQSMARLRESRQDLSEWLGSVRHGSGESWDEVKQGFGAATERFEEAYNNTLEAMKTES